MWFVGGFSIYRVIWFMYPQVQALNGSFFAGGFWYFSTEAWKAGMDNGSRGTGILPVQGVLCLCAEDRCSTKITVLIEDCCV